MWKMVQKLEEGQTSPTSWRADLGGGVYKIRLARPGEGKSGGYRVILYFRNDFRTFLVYGFSKSDRDNINERELKAFKADANDQFNLTNEQIEVRLLDGTLFEVF